MSVIVGHGIVIAVLLVIIYFCGRSVIRNIRAELRGGSCGGCCGCSGGCSGCGSAGNCAQAKVKGASSKRG